MSTRPWRRPTPIPRYRALRGHVVPIDDIRLPALPGSELRGLLTQGLIRVGRHRDGDPAPFTLTPQWLGPPLAPDRLVECPAERPIAFHLLWFGPEPDPRPVVEAALAAAGLDPLLGREGRRSRFLARVEPAGPGAASGDALAARCAALAGAEALVVRALTPLALRSKGAVRGAFGDGRALLISVRHRAARLAQTFGAQGDLEPLRFDNGPLGVRADDTRLIRYRRYGRQGRFTPMEGLLGAVCVERPPPSTLRALVLGEALRVGRWTAFGAGRYGVEAADDR